MNYLQWLLYQHTLLSLCFARGGRAVDVPCCFCCNTCGCIEMDAEYSVGQRIFVFYLVFLVNMFVSYEISSYNRGWVFTFILTTLLVMPFTCWLKQHVPSAAKKLRRKNVLLPVLLGWIILLGLPALGWLRVSRSVGRDSATQLFVTGLKVYVMQLLLEFYSLTWKYFFCLVCFRRCMPSNTDLFTFREASDQLFRGPARTVPLETATTELSSRSLA